MFRKELDNWSDLHSIANILEEKGDGYNFFGDRKSIFNYRIHSYGVARKSIDLFAGDFYSESSESFGSPEREFEELKKARDRGVIIKILGKWEPSSAQLTYWNNQYASSEYPEDSEIRKRGGNIQMAVWGNGIRGGIFDDDEAYIIHRQIKMPLVDLTLKRIKKASHKIISKPQKDSEVPIQALITRSPYIVKMFKKRFNKEYSNATSMKNELNKFESNNLQRREDMLRL